MAVPSTDVSVLLSRLWRWAPFVVLLVFLGAVAGWASYVGEKTTYTTKAALTVLSQNRSPDQDAILSQGYADYFNTDVYQTRLRQSAGVPANVTFEARTALASPILYVTATSDSESAVSSAASAMAAALRTQVNKSIDETHQQQIDEVLAAFDRLRSQEPSLPDQALLDLNQEISSIASDPSNKLRVVQLESSVAANSPSKMKQIALGAASGLFLGVLGALVLGGLSRRMWSTTEVEQALGSRPLAVLPRASDSAEAALLWATIMRLEPLVGSEVALTHARSRERTQEVGEQLARATSGASRLEPLVGSVVAVTHAHSRERTQEVGEQLARAASRSGKAVLLDWSKAYPEDVLGWSDYVQDGRLGLNDVVRQVGPNLCVVSYGTVDGDAYSAMASPRAKRLLNSLRDSFEAVVMTTPSLLETAEGPVACTLADATLVAIEAGRSRSDEVKEALRDLEALNVRVAGSVLLVKQRRRQHRQRVSTVNWTAPSEGNVPSTLDELSSETV